MTRIEQNKIKKKIHWRQGRPGVSCDVCAHLGRRDYPAGFGWRKQAACGATGIDTSIIKVCDDFIGKVET